MPKVIGKKRSDKFQEILDELTPKVKGDNKSEVLSGLKQLKGVFTDTIESLQNFGTENEEKRKTNNKLEKDNLKLKDENKTLTDNSEASDSDIKKQLKTATDEIETLKENAEKYDKHNKAEFIKRLTVAIKHPSWKNVKDKFASLKLGEDVEKNGKIDPEKITQEMIDENEIRLTDLTDAGLFGKVSKDDTPSKNVSDPDGTGDIHEIKTTEDLTDKLNEGFKELET